MLVGEGLVSDHMGATRRVMGQGRYLLGPMFSCHSDLIRGPDQEEDQLSLSSLFWCTLSELTHTTSEESKPDFLHNENWWLSRWATWQTPQWKDMQDRARVMRLSEDMWGRCNSIELFKACRLDKREAVLWADTGHPAHKTARTSSQRHRLIKEEMPWIHLRRLHKYTCQVPPMSAWLL